MEKSGARQFRKGIFSTRASAALVKRCDERILKNLGFLIQVGCTALCSRSWYIDTRAGNSATDGWNGDMS